ncbi:lysophospholipid acyltransferase family protein [Candidatus Cytomitobacter indipagum]|nr:lysophospholipid acyltransferase family protein [Candidatus Cytomitobacter indipagum]
MIAIVRFFGVKSEIVGKVPSGSAIICSNHQSYYEIILLFAALDRPVFVLKASILKIPIYNLYCKVMGMIPVDRSRFNKDWQDLAKKQLEKGKQVIMFPEGTRVPIGRTVSYKPGAFKLAKDMNMQIYPASTNAGEIWSGPGFLKKTGKVYVKFHDPIDPDPILLRDAINSVVKI